MERGWSCALLLCVYLCFDASFLFVFNIKFSKELKSGFVRNLTLSAHLQNFNKLRLVDLVIVLDETFLCFSTLKV